jgi:hypothetical protein
VAAAVALLLAAAFGAGDQYLGSLSWHPWAADVSLLSAPWLVLPFLAGWSQRSPRQAALLGLGCTLAALTGYGVMTLSPIENAHPTWQTVSGFVHSEARVFVGGLASGPLFGWLGYRWRTERAWIGALATAIAVALEPLAHSVAGDPIRFHAVASAEVAVGLAMGIYVVAARYAIDP